MKVLIVYASQFGNTEHLAAVISSALEPRHTVRAVAAKDARGLTGDGIDLLIVGAPTQMFGRRHLLAPSSITWLNEASRAWPPRPSTHGWAPRRRRTASEAESLAAHLAGAGCRLIVPPESFLVASFTGPLVEGEEQRAKSWASAVAEHAAVAIL